VSATTDLILRYQEAGTAERAAMRKRYPGFFGSSKTDTRCPECGETESGAKGLLGCKTCHTPAPDTRSELEKRRDNAIDWWSEQDAQRHVLRSRR
jgi:hypothetical protein